jgi:Fe2+ or Zn2+ uptake regulation protein
LTRPRQAVLAALSLSAEHLNPAEIYERARAVYPKIGLVTVYRALDLLTQLGCIQRVHLDEGCHSYVRAGEGHSHQLICKECGRVEAFSECELEKVIRRLSQKTGFAIEGHRLELLGRCPECR